MTELTEQEQRFVMALTTERLDLMALLKSLHDRIGDQDHEAAEQRAGLLRIQALVAQAERTDAKFREDVAKLLAKIEEERTLHRTQTFAPLEAWPEYRAVRAALEG